MPLMRWEPLREIDSLQREMNRLFDSFSTDGSPMERTNSAFVPGAKPGSALALSNTYVANCQPNILNYQEAYDNSFNPLNNFSSCRLVVYKPNNPQYAQQGAVSSSTRMLKLNVTTIETNAASFKKNAQGVKITTSNITSSSQPGMPFILKNKVPKLCNPPVNPFQNKNVC
jgi:hypothetical protein